MKNLQTIKKIAATLMTVAMIFTSLSLSAFADDAGTVKVTNVEEGAVVKIYQFVGMETIDGQGEWVTFISEQTADPGYAVKKS